MIGVLFLETRKKIYNVIFKNPGLNLSKIAELSEMSVSLADYHLHYMAESELITEVKDGGYKRYYAKGTLDRYERKILSLLNQDVPLKIILFFLQHGHGKPQHILGEIQISSALLTYYLKKLTKYRVIAKNAFYGKKDFILVNKRRIVNLLIQYKPNTLAHRYRDSWVVDIPLSSKVKKEKQELKGEE